MNKRIAKLIRKAAAELPASVIERTEGRTLDKSTMTPEQLAKVAHIPGRFVRHKGVFQVELNHERQLKNYYKKYGAEVFIEKYMAWFIPHHQKMLKKYPDQVIVQPGVVTPQ